jgi:hypothetical protein
MQIVEITTVSHFYLTRYMGNWHEIARYPNSFQMGCVGSKATYTLLDDDQKLSVVFLKTVCGVPKLILSPAAFGLFRPLPFYNKINTVQTIMPSTGRIDCFNLA